MPNDIVPAAAPGLPTRRSVIAGAAVALAVTSSASADTQSILSQIMSEHRAAYDGLSAALTAHETLDASLPDDVTRAPRAVTGSYSKADGSREAIYAYSLDEIDQTIASARQPAEAVFGPARAAKIADERHAELVSAFREDAAAQEAKQRAVGLTAAEAAVAAARERENAALTALAEFTPATISELWQWLAYIDAHEHRMWGSGELNFDHPNGLTALAVRALLKNRPAILTA